MTIALWMRRGTSTGPGFGNRFTPPVRDVSSRYAVDSSTQEKALFRHIERAGRGVNIYKLNNGTYTENFPGTWDSVTYVYLGGSTYEVTDTERDALISAGYSVDI